MQITPCKPNASRLTRSLTRETGATGARMARKGLSKVPDEPEGRRHKERRAPGCLQVKGSNSSYWKQKGTICLRIHGCHREANRRDSPSTREGVESSRTAVYSCGNCAAQRQLAQGERGRGTVHQPAALTYPVRRRQGFAQAELLPPRGCLHELNTCLTVTKGGCCWHLVSRGQEHCWKHPAHRSAP